MLRLQLGICLSDCYGHHTHIVEGDLNEGHINTHYDQMADSRAVLYYKHVKQVTHPNTFNSYYLDHPIEYPVTAHEPLKGLCKVKKIPKIPKKIGSGWVGPGLIRIKTIGKSSKNKVLRLYNSPLLGCARGATRRMSAY